jgi:hypothetical protein
MRKPSKAKPKQGEPYADVPPGGRAFQRIQQDRQARGLPELPEPGKAPDDDPKSKKKKSAKRSKREK